jgi:hypothetical protein
VSRGASPTRSDRGRDRRCADGCIGRDKSPHTAANVKLKPLAVNFGQRGVGHKAVQLLGHVVPPNPHARTSTIEGLEENAAKWAPILKCKVDLVEAPARHTAPSLDTPDLEGRAPQAQIFDPVSTLRQSLSHSRATRQT